MIDRIMRTFKPTWVWIEAKLPLTKEDLQAIGVDVDPKWSKKDTVYIATCDMKSDA